MIFLIENQLFCLKKTINGTVFAMYRDPAWKRDMMDIQSMVIDSPLGSRPKGGRIRS